MSKARPVEQIEHSQFCAFRKLVEDFPDGEVIHEDAPDFRVLSASETVGIEHCRVYKPSNTKISEHAIAEWEDEITASAQRLAELRGTPPVQVSVFYGTGTISRAERKGLPRAIARAVHEKVPLKSGRIEIDCSRVPELRNWLSTITISKHEVFDRHHWQNPRAQWVLQDCIEVLQIEIDKKSKLLPSYLQSCDSAWLLMASDASRMSQSIHPNEASLAHIYRSSYSRTYFFDIAMSKLYRLNTSSA